MNGMNGLQILQQCYSDLSDESIPSPPRRRMNCSQSSKDLSHSNGTSSPSQLDSNPINPNLEDNKNGTNSHSNDSYSLHSNDSHSLKSEDSHSLDKENESPQSKKRKLEKTYSLSFEGTTVATIKKAEVNELVFDCAWITRTGSRPENQDHYILPNQSKIKTLNSLPLWGVLDG